MPSGYYLPIQVVQTAGTAANSTVFSMRNTGGATIYIARLHLMAGFDGTGAATTSRYDVARFRDATPTGGTAVTVVKRDALNAGSGISDARVLDTGLTTTGVTFDTPLCYVGFPRRNGGSGIGLDLIDIRNDIQTEQGIVIANNDGLCIRLGVAAVAGDSITGFVYWLE